MGPALLLLGLTGCSEQTLHKSADASPAYGESGGPHETHWYIVDDGTPYETHSNPEFEVDYHGDPSLYWYEPSGAHGLVASADPDADFQTLRDYIVDRAGEPTFLDSPLRFRSTSELDTYEYATFTYILCEFWVDEGDTASFELSVEVVDDGVLVLLNAGYVGHLLLGEGGSWELDVVPGQTNAVAVILVDDSKVDRFLEDLALTRDGVLIN